MFLDSTDPISCVKRVAIWIKFPLFTIYALTFCHCQCLTSYSCHEFHGYFIRTAHIALSPASLGNLKAGVAQYFSSHINRYHPALHGILLGYRCNRILRNYEVAHWQQESKVDGKHGKRFIRPTSHPCRRHRWLLHVHTSKIKWSFGDYNTHCSCC